jgi:hypothetical protein
MGTLWGGKPVGNERRIREDQMGVYEGICLKSILWMYETLIMKPT